MAFYVLLVGIEDYRDLSLGNLASASLDLSLMRRSLEKDLKISGDRIRVMGEEGPRVVREDLALSMASFLKLLTKEDSLIFYFSGHGNGESILFSDGPVRLQSIIDFIDGMDIKSALVILDCCYAGSFSAPGTPFMIPEESLSAFAGRGIAVMASSSADQRSRLSGPGGASIFTRALTEAMGEKRLVRRGRISLQDLSEEAAFYVSLWNRQHPERAQHPVFRTAMGGTVFFTGAEETECRKEKVFFETPSCLVTSVKTMDAADLGRLCAFALPKKSVEAFGGAEGEKALACMAREIAESLAEMPGERFYAGKRRHPGRKARAVWCYFAGDAADLEESLYFAVCIWAGSPEMKKRYYREDRYSHVTDGILVQRNISYGMLKKMQSGTMTRQECLSEYGKLLAETVNTAAPLIRDLQETENGLISREELKEKYRLWAGRVRAMYIRLSEQERPPRDLYEWTEGICDLAGWVLDLSLYLERESIREERDRWLIRNALRHYYESMDALAELEAGAGIRKNGAG